MGDGRRRARTSAGRDGIRLHDSTRSGAGPLDLRLGNWEGRKIDCHGPWIQFALFGAYRTDGTYPSRIYILACRRFQALRCVYNRFGPRDFDFEQFILLTHVYARFFNCPQGLWSPGGNVGRMDLGLFSVLDSSFKRGGVGNKSNDAVTNIVGSTDAEARALEEHQILDWVWIVVGSIGSHQPGHTFHVAFSGCMDLVAPMEARK